jgi:hypothetical protein
MQCPFRYRRRWQKFSFGVDPGFMDFVTEQDDRAEVEFNEKYPTCWDKFLHWLGWEPTPRQVTPCPYCANQDRDDNGNAVSGGTGNCLWVEDKRVSVGADAPCVVDNYGTLKGS